MSSNILIIDDEEIILESLSMIFKREGLDCDVEANPLVAVEKYPQINYNVVLVDVLMPQMQGAQVIRTIKSSNPLANIIVMTAFSNMSHVIECIEAGAVDYITKPFTDINLLVSIVKITLDRVDRWKHSFGI